MQRGERPSGDCSNVATAMKSEIALNGQRRSQKFEYRVLAINTAGEGEAKQQRHGGAVSAAHGVWCRWVQGHPSGRIPGLLASPYCALRDSDETGDLLPRQRRGLLKQGNQGAALTNKHLSHREGGISGGNRQE